MPRSEPMDQKTIRAPVTLWESVSEVQKHPDFLQMCRDACIDPSITAATRWLIAKGLQFVKVSADVTNATP